MTQLDPRLEERKDEYERNGFVVIDSVLTAGQVDQLKSELQPYLDANITGRNDFEGFRSHRIYALLAKSNAVAELVQNPLALQFAEAELGSSCLLSACLAINLQPGESEQPWHYDDAHLEIPRPRPAYGLSVFWALDDTTEENGATEVIAGSHLWGTESPEGAVFDGDFLALSDSKKNGNDQTAQPHNIVKVTMKSGSLMLAKGTLWHRGGANVSEQSRMIITPQYCPGWARQLESMAIAVAPERVARLPQRVQELIGYSIHPPFMGYADGVHPSRHLPK